MFKLKCERWRHRCQELRKDRDGAVQGRVKIGLENRGRKTGGTRLAWNRQKHRVKRGIDR